MQNKYREIDTKLLTILPSLAMLPIVINKSILQLSITNCYF